MAKFYGKIGYAFTGETKPGVWVDDIIEKDCIGDFVRNTRKLENSGGVNDNININNTVSIVADPYATENFHSIKYVKYLGVAWKVTTVEVQFPRLILTLGGEYNAQ
jgi:hypothetical protein